MGLVCKTYLRYELFLSKIFLKILFSLKYLMNKNNQYSTLRWKTRSRLRLDQTQGQTLHSSLFSRSMHIPLQIRACQMNASCQGTLGLTRPEIPKTRFDKERERSINISYKCIFLRCREIIWTYSLILACYTLSRFDLSIEMCVVRHTDVHFLALILASYTLSLFDLSIEMCVVHHTDCTFLL